VHIGLEDVIAAEEARGPRQVKLGALLEVLQGAAADAEALRRAVLRVAVELAGDVAQPRRRPPRMLVMVTLSLATMPMDARFNRRVEWMRKSALLLLKHRAALRGGNNHFCRNGLT
jgi:hypothetical protein